LPENGKKKQKSPKKPKKRCILITWPKGGQRRSTKMNKQQAVAVAKAMRLDGHNVQVAYETLTHANSNGQQGVSLVYRVVESGKVVL
jgi:hypothetical protein